MNRGAAWARALLPSGESKADEVKSPPSLGPVALQILAYLRTHRDAQDTIEGIAEWWLLEQRIRHVINEVKKALTELVAQGMVLEHIGRDGRIHYRLNPRKKTTVTHLLREMNSELPIAQVNPMASETLAPR